MSDRFRCEHCGHAVLDATLVETLEWIERRIAAHSPPWDYVTSAEVGERFHLTITAASQRVRSLWMKGWLERERMTRVGQGGHFYAYRIGRSQWA